MSAMVITGSYVPFTELVDSAQGLGKTMVDMADLFKAMEASADSLYLQRNSYLDAMNGPSLRGAVDRQDDSRCSQSRAR